MQVFVSLSKSESWRIARVFADWMQEVIQAVEPFVSVDIEKGALWETVLVDELRVFRLSGGCGAVPCHQARVCEASPPWDHCLVLGAQATSRAHVARRAKRANSRRRLRSEYHDSVGGTLATYVGP